MWKDMEDKYQDPQRIVDRYRFFCDTHAFLGESFPNLNVDFGPGSLAPTLDPRSALKKTPYGLTSVWTAGMVFRSFSLIRKINGLRNISIL